VLRTRKVRGTCYFTAEGQGPADAFLILV